MKKWILVFIAIGLFSAAKAQSNGSKMVDRLCGCFEVDFRYAETFSPDPAYQFHPREETGGTAELALPIEWSDKKIVIQHLLITGPSMVVKHWREEWVYENREFWQYQGNRTWTKHLLSADTVKGKWMQTVWEVADEPRYQGWSPFVVMDGRILWQHTTDAPLPRREYSVRNDYNILRRTNRIQLTDSGYLHEQDNQKINRMQGIDHLLAEEKGWNRYRRIPEKECAAALAYWEKNKSYWAMVRTYWTEYLLTHDRITLLQKVDGKMLHEYLMAQAKDWEMKPDSETSIRKRIQETILRFIVVERQKALP